MKDKAWMFHQPVEDFFAVMCADIIAHEMNRADVMVNLRIQLFQKGDEFLLTLTGVTVPKDGSRTSIECRK